MVIELTLGLLAVALIGWLFGGLLWKSGDYDERALRRRLETTLAERDEALEISRETTADRWRGRSLLPVLFFGAAQGRPAAHRDWLRVP